MNNKKNLTRLSGLALLSLTVAIGCNLRKNDVKDTASTSNQTDMKTTGDTQTLASGLKVVYLKQNNQAKPVAGDNVSVHYVGTLMDGTEFDNSVKRGEPISFPLGQGRVIKGWDEGIALLGKGDKALFIIPPHLAYGEQSVGNGLIPANSTLQFEVELVDFKEAYKRFDITGKEAITTASGLKFYIINEGDLSRKPKVGQTAITHYAGYLQNGTKFDASYDRGQPFPVPVGQGQVIKGWDEILPLMGIGSKYTVVIPPALGYGANGAPPSIPANATIIFDMELLDIK